MASWLIPLIEDTLPLERLRALGSPRLVSFGTSVERGEPAPQRWAPPKPKRTRARRVSSMPRAEQRQPRRRRAYSPPPVVMIAPSAVENPYRKGSKKRQAFEIFKQGGERTAVTAAIRKLGVTKTTAPTWIYYFRNLVAYGAQEKLKKNMSRPIPCRSAAS